MDKCSVVLFRSPRTLNLDKTPNARGHNRDGLTSNGEHMQLPMIYGVNVNKIILLLYDTKP